MQIVSSRARSSRTMSSPPIRQAEIHDRQIRARDSGHPQSGRAIGGADGFPSMAFERPAQAVAKYLIVIDDECGMFAGDFRRSGSHTKTRLAESVSGRSRAAEFPGPATIPGPTGHQDGRLW